MTNHIEELMKAAGIKPETVTDYELNEYKVYPDFTPAKQLELIKLILKGDKTYNLELEYVGVCDHYCFSWFDATVTYDNCITVKNKYYELALAELVYTLINENKLDKSEVKRILSGAD